MVVEAAVNTAALPPTLFATATAASSVVDAAVGATLVSRVAGQAAAIATPVAVITTPVAAIPEAVIENETGKLVPVGDEKALALALEHLLTDQSLRLRLGSTARQEALARYDAAKNYPQILARLKGLAPLTPAGRGMGGR